MKERGLRWYLFGAQAAIIGGSPRLSADVDVTAQIDLAALDDSVLGLLERALSQGDLLPVFESEWRNSASGAAAPDPTERDPGAKPRKKK
jgi:hypothetical protein